MERLKKASEHISNGEYDKANTLLEDIISSKPTLTTKLMALVMLINITRLNGDYNKLSDLYSKLGEYVPSYNIFFKSGEANLLAGRYQTAQKMYEKSYSLAKKNEDRINSLVYISISYLLTDDFEKAAEYYHKAKDVDKKHTKQMFSKIINNIVSKNENIPKNHKEQISKLLAKLK
ncbi:tetratricopeptide repeat protein [Candidatus Micrarchaeota archaeon]|nr:tetratricopeptide repeat protein [Candidatus Micrarchaeota archaeon]